MKKVTNIIGIVFIIIGIFVMIFLNTFNFNFNMGIDNPKETIAYITKIEDDDIYVSYNVDGIKYEKKSNFYSSNMNVGDTIKIIYESDNPRKFNIKINDIIENNVKNIKYIFFIIPGIFIFIGLIFILSNLIKKITNKNLLNTGFMLMAKISSVDYNENININGKHPYIITANFIYNNLAYQSKSEDIWFDINYILDTFGITEVPVYIDPNNPKKNIIDISEIKSKLGK